MRATLIFGAVFLLHCIRERRAADDAAAPCQVHVILFVPADVKPPAGYQQRMDQIVDYTESFFRRGFKRWGHEKVVMPFRRSADGHVEVTVIRGKEKTSQYKPVTVRMRSHGRDAAAEQARRRAAGLVDHGVRGRPAGEVRRRSSAGSARRSAGGRCATSTPRPAASTRRRRWARTSWRGMALKGMIHELGHAFQLPHVGPLKRDDAGNTLMGPTHHNYRRVVPAREQRVYLSEAEAAMLSTHPAFRGAADERGPLPKVEVQDMKYAANPRNNTIVVSGRVRAPRGVRCMRWSPTNPTRGRASTGRRPTWARSRRTARLK